MLEGFWTSLVIERIASWKLGRGTIDDRHGAAAIELAHLACRRPLAIDAIAIRRWVEEIQNTVRSGPLESWYLKFDNLTFDCSTRLGLRKSNTIT